MTGRDKAAAGPPAIDTTSLGARLSQIALAVVLTIISVVLMIATHRVEVELLGAELPAGLLFGAALQTVSCVFLWASTGSRLPLLVVGMLWGILAMPFLGSGVGGGVLMPAAIGEDVQYAGWIVQMLGVGIPFLTTAVITLARRRRPRA